MARVEGSTFLGVYPGLPYLHSGRAPREEEEEEEEEMEEEEEEEEEEEGE